MYIQSSLYKLIARLMVLSILFSSFPASAVTQAHASPSTEIRQQNRISDQVSDGLPLATSSPVSLSRVQSSYMAGRTTITLIIVNNLPPTWLPEISDTANYTETIDILAASSVADDVNSLANVSLSDSLSPGTTLVAASGDPVQTGNNLSWTLPDIPPLGSASITLTVQTPSAGADFVDIDSGGQVSAERWEQAVSADAPPSVIIPNGINSAYTQSTAGADINDQDMLWKSAQLDQDPLALFAEVRSYDNDPYTGSLRGTRGSLWNKAGNSADKASLLIAMLPRHGYPRTLSPWELV